MFFASGHPRFQAPCPVLCGPVVEYPPEKTAWTQVYANRKSLSSNQQLHWALEIPVENQAFLRVRF